MTEPLGAMLMVERGFAEASIIPLQEKVHTFGNLPGVNTIIANPYVSRRHAEVSFVGGEYQIRDLGSKNGTFVNGTRVEGAGQRLLNGDRTELGRDQVVLRFETRNVTMTLEDRPASEVTLVDTTARNVQVGQTPLNPPLSPREFAVFLLLHERRGKTCSGKEIAARAWPVRENTGVTDQEIEQCMRRLRLRLEPDPAEPRYIITVHGQGYKLAQG